MPQMPRHRLELFPELLELSAICHKIIFNTTRLAASLYSDACSQPRGLLPQLDSVFQISVVIFRLCARQGQMVLQGYCLKQ